jgi:Ran-binding protein 3
LIKKASSKLKQYVDSQTNMIYADVLQIPPVSGFSNASAVSPFAALSGNKLQSKDSAPVAEMHTTTIKDVKPVSSPFGAFGQSIGTSSPFGALAGGAKPSGDAGPKTESVFGGFSGSTSAFGSIGSKSTLGGAFGGFGSASSPFASAATGKGGLSSFASSASSGSKPPILGLSSKPAKPFGAPLSDEEDNDGSDDDDADATDVSKDVEQGVVPQTNEQKRDKRFVEQEVETGEEHERTLFSSRAKLYYFDTKEGGWKERGVGTFKFNVTRSEGSADTDDDTSELAVVKKARFIMRAEGSHRLLLNSPLSGHTKFGDVNGLVPKGTTVLWTGIIEDKPVGLQLRVSLLSFYSPEAID